MKTVTIDIINEKALNLLRDMEVLKLIKLHQVKGKKNPEMIKYKGAMSKQPIGEVDQQLNDLRNEWE
jgi:rRNA processing protein Krr1/Pno1